MHHPRDDSRLEWICNTVIAIAVLIAIIGFGLKNFFHQKSVTKADPEPPPFECTTFSEDGHFMFTTTNRVVAFSHSPACRKCQAVWTNDCMNIWTNMWTNTISEETAENLYFELWNALRMIHPLHSRQDPTNYIFKTPNGFSIVRFSLYRTTPLKPTKTPE